MIAVGSFLNVSDNSGARVVQCIRIYKRKKVGSIGDKILVTVKTHNPKKKIKSGELYKGVIVRTRFFIKKNNNYYKFNDNAVVLVNKKNMPLGSILFGVSVKYIRLNYRKIFLLLEDIV